MSEIRDLCRKTYQQFVAVYPMPNELRRALKTHERVPVFLDNMADQLSKPGLKVSKAQVIQSTEDMTKLFIAALEAKTREDSMSAVAKLTLKAKHDELVRLDQAADGLQEDKENVETKNGTETTRQTHHVPPGVL